MHAPHLKSYLLLMLACWFPMLMVGCHAASSEKVTDAETANAEKPTVYVSRVELGSWPEIVQVQGSLLADERSIVGAELAGRVEKVQVDLGSIVLEGEPIVTLDAEELILAVEQAEAELNQACAAIGMKPSDSELKLNRENAPPVRLESALLSEARASAERGKQLLERKVITESEYEALVAQLEAADARHQSALNRVGEQIALIGVKRSMLAHRKQQLAVSRIVAPFDGVVERRHVAPGEYVQVGSSVITMVRTDVLRFTAGVPERSASFVQEGQQIRVLVDGESAPLLAKVTRVSPTVNQTNRSLAIEADLPNPGLRFRTGLFAEAEIVIDPQASSLTLPASAVRQFAGIEKVWVVTDGVAKERPVRIGRREDDRVEVVDGISDGELVVINSEEGKAGEVVAVFPQGNETKTANVAESDADATAPEPQGDSVSSEGTETTTPAPNPPVSNAPVSKEASEASAGVAG